MSLLWTILCICVGGTVFSVFASRLVYLLPTLYIQRRACKAKNLKKRYSTEWALVTGASNGIGKSLAIKLARQGLNVVLVALDDANLFKTTSFLRSAFPMLEFRSVGADLSVSGDDGNDYMKKIEDSTKDINVGVVVNNAGFLLMGYFDEVDEKKHTSIINCNATASIRVAHHFYRRMARAKRPGCLLFTSSSAWLLPSPFAILYGATKALISSFAISLSIEAEKYDVEVCVVHPCYTRTGLYDNSPKVGVLKLLNKFAWTPDQVADVMLKAVGRVVSLDLGWYSVVSRDSMAPQRESAEKKKVK